MGLVINSRGEAFIGDSSGMTVYKCVAENRVETYHVQVPVCVEKDIQVRVCRMVPQRVVYKVPVHDGCGHCGRAPCCCD